MVSHMQGHMLVGVSGDEYEMEMASQETSSLLKNSEDTPLYDGKSKKGNHKLILLALTGLLVCFVVATIVLAALLGYHIANEEDCLNSCTTSSCLEASSFLMQGLDTSADPCEDFYKYSCGNWEATNVIPEGFGRYSTFSELGTSNSIALMKALEEPVPEGDDGAVSKARYMYARCMDVDTLDNRGAEPLQEMITLNGGWELVNVAESEPWSLESSLKREHYYGSDAFFGIDIQPDDFDSNVVIIKVLWLYVGMVCVCACVYMHVSVSVCVRAHALRVCGVCGHQKGIITCDAIIYFCYVVFSVGAHSTKQHLLF